VVARQQVETKSSSKAKRSLGFTSGKENIALYYLHKIIKMNEYMNSTLKISA
jgi:hypothetical protein